MSGGGRRRTSAVFSNLRPIPTNFINFGKFALENLWVPRFNLPMSSLGATRKERTLSRIVFYAAALAVMASSQYHQRKAASTPAPEAVVVPTPYFGIPIAEVSFLD